MPNRHISPRINNDAPTFSADGPGSTTCAMALQTLTPAQQLVADEVADILVHGGHCEDTSDLVDAVLRHQYRRRFGRIATKENVDNFLKTNLPDFLDKLQADWSHNARAKDGERTPPATALDRIRRKAIGQLRYAFESFVAEATPEEHRILTDIFAWCDSEGPHDRTAVDDLPLASALEHALHGTKADYVRLPHAFRELVDPYINTLMAAEPHLAGGADVRK